MHNKFFTINEPNEAEKGRMKLATEYMNRRKYGTYKGHFKWDLAVSFFRMDNDTFFKIHGFNYVPTGSLWEEAKNFRWKY